MVTSMTEVSGWQVDLRWAARPQSADVVAELTLRSRDQFVCQFPAFGGTWTVSSVAGAVDFDGAEVLDLVRSSVLRVDGVPDPARGFSFLVHSPAVGGIYATIRVRAGASHPTRRIAPNSITVDFSSEQFGEPVFDSLYRRSISWLPRDEHSIDVAE